MIDEQKRALTGSASRDRFKQLHKEKLPDNCYALDIDFALVEKNQHRGEDQPLIAAILDFKTASDDLTFTEVLAYNQFLEKNIPVYVVESETNDFAQVDVADHRFTIKEYNGGNWRLFPPSYECEVLREGATWRVLKKWEDKLRIERRKEVRNRQDY